VRLLIVTNQFPFPGETSRGTFNANQFLELPADIDVHVVVPVPFRQWRRSYGAVHDWGRCRVRYLPFYYPPGFAQGWHGDAYYLSLLIGARRWLSDVDPEVVLGSFLYPDGYAAARLAAAMHVPLVLKAHGSDVNQKSAAPALRRGIGRALGQAAAVVVVSAALRQQLELLGTSRDKIKVVYNGVNTAAFSPQDRAACRAQLGLPEAGRLALFAGNLKADKGAVDAVHAICRLNADGVPARLVIVGDGAAATEMRRVVEQCGAQDLLLWQGRRPHRELATFMNAVDVLVLPSHAEGVPNVVLEALACGTPVVATAVGGIPEVLYEAAGALVPARDITALAHAMGEVFNRPFDRAAIRAQVAHLSWPGSAAQLADVLRSAVDGAAARAMP